MLIPAVASRLASVPERRLGRTLTIYAPVRPHRPNGLPRQVAGVCPSKVDLAVATARTAFLHTLPCAHLHRCLRVCPRL
jgi:hypothetical protein